MDETLRWPPLSHSLWPDKVPLDWPYKAKPDFFGEHPLQNFGSTLWQQFLDWHHDELLEKWKNLSKSEQLGLGATAAAGLWFSGQKIDVSKSISKRVSIGGYIEKGKPIEFGCHVKIKF